MSEFLSSVAAELTAAGIMAFLAGIVFRWKQRSDSNEESPSTNSHRSGKGLFFLGLGVGCLLMGYLGSRYSRQSLSFRSNNSQLQLQEIVITKSGEMRNSIGMTFRLLPAGSFQMGSPETELHRSADETQHEVRMTQPFYMGTHEVTQKQFQRIMGYQPGTFGSDGNEPNLPIESVNWFEAVHFCNILSRIEDRDPYYLIEEVKRNEEHRIIYAEVSIKGGAGYRLPTEAEWEYACRAGTRTIYNHGNRISTADANFDGTQPYLNSSEETEQKSEINRQQPVKVGSFNPNSWGLYDMHGNVWEWCEDWYRDTYEPQDQTNTPNRSSTAEERVVRGGGWISSAKLCRSANRGRFHPEFTRSYLGFRICL